MPYILGIDSSTKCTGWAMIDTESGKLLKLGRVIPPKDLYYVDRWVVIVKGLEDVVKENGDPVVVGIEEPNCFTNGNTVRLLCGIFGIISYTFSKAGLFVHAVNTAHAKSIFVGSEKSGEGHAKKTDTIAKANKMFGLTLTHKERNVDGVRMSDEDLADAIQVAYCLRFDLIKAKTPGFL
jgi:Holliday junction resolvasome RuvABC endonuclease subunit